MSRWSGVKPWEPTPGEFARRPALPKTAGGSTQIVMCPLRPRKKLRSPSGIASLAGETEVAIAPVNYGAQAFLRKPYLEVDGDQIAHWTLDRE